MYPPTIAQEYSTIIRLPVAHKTNEYTSPQAASIMGDHNPVTGDHRPVAVISDGDVTFMTQLSSDIVRSINRITNIRQHGTRMQTRKRRVKHGRANTDASPPLIRNSSVRMRSRTSREVTPLSGSKHTRVCVLLFRFLPLRTRATPFWSDHVCWSC